MRSRFAYEIGIGSNYLELVTACLRWADESRMHLLTSNKLVAAVSLPSFQTICKTHEDVQKCGLGNIVPEFLLELVDGKYGLAFLIPYAYLKNSVPEPYSKILLSLGVASELPRIFEKLNIAYNPQPSSS